MGILSRLRSFVTPEEPRYFGSHNVANAIQYIGYLSYKEHKRLNFVIGTSKGRILFRSRSMNGYVPCHLLSRRIRSITRGYRDGSYIDDAYAIWLKGESDRIWKL